MPCDEPLGGVARRGRLPKLAVTSAIRIVEAPASTHIATSVLTTLTSVTTPVPDGVSAFTRFGLMTTRLPLTRLPSPPTLAIASRTIMSTSASEVGRTGSLTIDTVVSVGVAMLAGPNVVAFSYAWRA